MNRATRQKLSALRSLADHPKTPEHERDSARARIREIEAKVHAEEDRKRAFGRKAMPRGMAGMSDRVSRQGLAQFKNIRRATAIDIEDTVHDQWPFGWTGTRKLDEIEKGYGVGGSYSIGWKCPDCGGHVSRTIDQGLMFRFASNPDALKDYVHRITSEETNHLCVSCWRKWNER